MTDQNYVHANDGIRIFAKASIAAAITINSGALLAVLSQLDKLIKLVALENIRWCFFSWTTGVTVGALSWVCAYAAASAYANGMRKTEIASGYIGAFLILGSILAFALGMYLMGIGIKID